MNGVIFPYVIPFFLHVDTVNLTIYASRVGLLGQTKAGWESLLIRIERCQDAPSNYGDSFRVLTWSHHCFPPHIVFSLHQYAAISNLLGLLFWFRHTCMHMRHDFPYSVLLCFVDCSSQRSAAFAPKKALNLEVLDRKDSEIIQLVHNRALFRFQRHASSFAM